MEKKWYNVKEGKFWKLVYELQEQKLMKEKTGWLYSQTRIDELEEELKKYKKNE